MAEEAEKRPLRQISQSFKELASAVTSGNDGDVRVASFSHACSLVSILFGCLGFAFKFAELDYVAKVRDLKEAANSLDTLQSLLDLDVKSNSVRGGGSHSHNLLRVKRGLDMVKVLFEQILATDGNSLRDPASVAYAQVFSAYHGWAIRKAVSAGMYALPTKAQLLRKLNEDEASARLEMQNYVTASAPVIQYVDNLFLSRNLGIDWPHAFFLIPSNEEEKERGNKHGICRFDAPWAALFLCHCSHLLTLVGHKRSLKMNRSCKARVALVWAISSEAIFGYEKQLLGLEKLLEGMSAPTRYGACTAIVVGSLTTGYALGSTQNAALGGAVALGVVGGATTYALNSSAPRIAALHLHNKVATCGYPTSLTKEDIDSIVNK
ncbi:hypothetical protein KI387_032348 [Taxus chinensis]|uniref:Glycolipid transfer protein domain-containing protein n=1 Tax=Taxus chinensis TaxID=29808 RepID=A0AA38BPX0_TAXCH|nr:hypothetical protein KI387_032348 [Taxus chinensis]